jgi:hypothetical protein
MKRVRKSLVRVVGAAAAVDSVAAVEAVVPAAESAIAGKPYFFAIGE